ncbi:P-loop NTPase [Candidatus Sumerlaeota bacterium]|nr:P-loop NTPase [Candidatus Sumerlaeota bacterium]
MKESSQNPHSDESRQLEEMELQKRLQVIKRKILVLSGKGGVGKSTVAANLAVSLALAGKKSGLLDIDLHGPSITRILGLEGSRLANDEEGLIAPLPYMENLTVVSIGLLLEKAEDAVIWRGPLKYNVIKQFLKDVSWGELDYLVVDSPPGTGDEPLSVAQMMGKDTWAIIVTTPQEVAIADVRRSVTFCKTLNLRIAGVIENMSGMVCPHCGKDIELFKVGGGERLAKEMGIPYLGHIPLDPGIVEAGDAGKSITDALSGTPTESSFKKIIDAIRVQTGDVDSPDLNSAIKEKSIMKIAIPVSEGMLCMHFGHCEQFALVTVDADKKSVEEVVYIDSPPHEPGLLPGWLHKQGANLIITGGMGRRAQDLFAKNGVKVIVGAPSDAPENIATAYMNNTLEIAENICDH